MKNILRTSLIGLTVICALAVVTTIQARGKSPTIAENTNTPPGVFPTEVPVVISTPMDDGTIKHIVAGGQTLWTIAAVYAIPLEELRELNNLEPDAILSLGDEIIIRPANTPTNTPIGEPSATLPPRFSHTPSPAAVQNTAVKFVPSTPSPTDTPRSEPRFQTSAKNPTIVILAVLISGGTLVSALFISLRKKD